MAITFSQKGSTSGRNLPFIIRFQKGEQRDPVIGGESLQQLKHAAGARMPAGVRKIGGNPQHSRFVFGFAAHGIFHSVAARKNTGRVSKKARISLRPCASAETEIRIELPWPE